MTDPRIIPLLDPEPTVEDAQRCAEMMQTADPPITMEYSANDGESTGTVAMIYRREFRDWLAAERVRIARQAIDWAIGSKPDIPGKCTCLEHRLKWHDAAIKERGGNRERD